MGTCIAHEPYLSTGERERERATERERERERERKRGKRLTSRRGGSGGRVIGL